MQRKLELDFQFLRFWVFTFLAIFLTGIIEYLILKGTGIDNAIIFLGAVFFGVLFVVTLIPFTVVYLRLRRLLR